VGSLANLILTFLDLLEAEGKAFRAGVAKVGLVVAFLTLVALMFVAGFGLIVWAIYLFLRLSLTPAPSALLTGIFTLILAGVLAWASRLTAR
jgi:hypothetical protein